MQGYKNNFINMNCASHRGPLVLIDGQPDEQDLLLAGRITARYGQGRDADEVTIQVREKDKPERLIQVKPIAANEIPEEWFV